jgi:hypothetical protein
MAGRERRKSKKPPGGGLKDHIQMITPKNGKTVKS